MYFSIFKIYLMDFLKNKTFLLISLCLPLILIFYSSFDTSVNFEIGVVCDFEVLSNINVIHFDSEEKLRESVANGTIGVGYIYKDGQCLQIYRENDFMHKFTAYGMLANIYKENSQDIALDFLIKNEIPTDNYAENFEFYKNSHNNFNYILEYVKDTAIIDENSSKFSVPMQIIMSYLLIFALSSNIDKKSSGFLLLSNIINKTKLEFSMLSPSFFITFTIALICFFTFCTIDLASFCLLFVYQILLIFLNIILRKLLQADIILGIMPICLACLILILN